MESDDEPDRLEGYPHPREARAVAGHQDAQAAFVDGIRSGRLHHAWLIGGAEGIGKATFAYAVAKFLLGPNAAAPSAGNRLVFDPDSREARQVAALAHPDLVVLRRQPPEEKKKASTQITVSNVRRALDVFGSTAGSGGWRVCIVDSAEDLNAAGANALLKVVEEPPPRAIFLIVAHQPGRVLPTIRSRCRKLMLRPLDDGQMATALRQAGIEPDTMEAKRAIALAGGSVRRAMTRLDADTVGMIDETRGMLAGLPNGDVGQMMRMADKLSGRTNEADFAIFVETIEDWASECLHRNAAQRPSELAPLAEVWDKIARAIREADALNLDRKSLVVSIFQDLTEAMRRMRLA